MNLNEIAREIKLTKDYYLEKYFSTTTSIVYNFWRTPEYKDLIQATAFGSGGRYEMIGWFDIHCSEDEAFRIYIRAKLRDYFSPATNLEGTLALIESVMSSLGIPKNTTFECDIINDRERSGIINRKDVLF